MSAPSKRQQHLAWLLASVIVLPAIGSSLAMAQPAANKTQPAGTAAPAPLSYAASQTARSSSRPSSHSEPAAPKKHRHRHHHNAAKSVLHEAETRSTEQPRPHEFVNSTLHYPYEPGKIYTIHTAPGFITVIALRPGEKLLSKAAGDTTSWLLGETAGGTPDKPQVLVMIKPQDEGLRTNLILTSDQRLYELELVSDTDGEHSSMIDWHYPADDMRDLNLQRAALTVQALAAQATALPASPFITPPGGSVSRPQGGPIVASYQRPGVDGDISPANLHFDYVIHPSNKHAPAWTPEHVFDDGKKTYIKFSANIATTEVPPLFVVGAKGDLELVNYRFVNGYYVVDRLFNVAELTIGTNAQQSVRILYKGVAR